jgi:cytochrome b561
MAAAGAETLGRYNAVAMSLHWLIAALIFSNIGLAWWFESLHGLAKIAPTQIHKSIGITVLMLSVLRLVWRFANRPPPLPASMPLWERYAAHAVHALLYVVMIGMPLTGWAMSSASTLIRVFPITWFGLFEWPTLVALANLPPERMKSAHHLFFTLHSGGAWLAYGLVTLHVLAALRHQFLKGDLMLWRMLPGRPA